MIASADAAGRACWLGLFLLGAVAVAGAAPSASSEAGTARESYSLGHQIGMDLARGGRHVDLDALARGLRDALAAREPAFPEAELNALLVELKRGIVARERVERIRPGPALRRAGEAFLAENAKREGVVVLPSGLQYRVVRPGTGPRPSPGDSVRIRYRSTRLDGTAFHDSLRPESPAETLRIEALIPGLQEVLPRMPVGARWEIFLPPQLAFGRRGPLADHTVVYDLELLGVQSGDASSEESRP